MSTPFNEADHPRNATGRFTETQHSEPESDLIIQDAPRRSAIAIRQMDQLKSDRWRIRNEIGTLAGMRIALETLQRFPDAATIRVVPDGEGGMTLLGVHDVHGEALADATGSDAEVAQAFSDWAGSSSGVNSTGEEDLRSLAAEMPDQDANWWTHATEVSEDMYNVEWDVNLAGLADGS